MIRVNLKLLMSTVVLCCLLCASSLSQASNERASLVKKHWTADNGNGTYSNPLFYEEFEDPDIIRVGEDYYLVGTTMHMNPALQIMHSKDLVNWELVGYCMDRLDFGPAFRLEEGKNIYGQGIWAPCIRYHNGMFYIFSNVNGVGLQVFRSKSIRGPWERNQLPGRHDLSVLFDDDGKVYIIFGNRNPYPIEELTPDLKSIVPDSRRMMHAPGMGEGHHLYKINGTYYDISAIPGATTDQMVARADSIDGPWTVERMVQGESLGVTTVALDYANANDRGLTLHQGGMCDTPSGEWWSVIMSDHGSVGRLVSLVPITWENGFPIIGLPGNLRKAPNTWIKPRTGYTQKPKPSFIHNDDFDSGKLNAEWQWNHVPDDSTWSLTEKHGVLRLHSLPADNLYLARNSICQRPPGPESIMTVELDTQGMVEGDTAGLALLSSPYAWIGVVKSAEGTTLQMVDSVVSRQGRRGASLPTVNPPAISADQPPNNLWLRIHCNFDNDKAIFSWSADGKKFTPLGKPFTMTFQLRTFQGVRPSLFHYNTSGKPGGYVDFDNYTVDEPRARGIEREIPLGKTILLTSGADGSYLAVDVENSILVNIPSHGKIPDNAKFTIIDLGRGRVMLQTESNEVASVAEDKVVLKTLGETKPGDAETFQWINLMNGDTMLMSLTNHRYLSTIPNSPGLVIVSATGPNPARKGGACFKWKEVNGEKTTIEIQGTEQGKPISPDLFGIFFEDLNYAADGGIYAELIQNRSFEYSPAERPDWHPLKFWDIEKRGGGDGSVTVAEMRPIHENNPYYALLTVHNPGDGVGVSNNGFDGIPIKVGETYDVSFWAYQAYMGRMWGQDDTSKPMPVTLRLETKQGELLDEVSIKILGREWRKVSAQFKPTQTVTDARLVLLAHERGCIALDMISLFPEKTFHNRSNGLRADLAQAIADIHPKFIRFPGGCLVHGQGIHRYYDWKESVGPVETRKAQRNLWGYHQTRGFGYFEFFQFCEDIGAKPLPVVTAGVCCQHAGSSPHRGQEGLPLDEMPDYIQDVLDLIEWANGPATSKWGKVRAEAGHPEPFGLKYLGVGNEDAITPIFKERFKMIYDVLSEKHPEITVIGTVGPFASGEDYDNGWDFANELKLEMVDEHYYVSPNWFWENLNRYDSYDRNASKVYVGEYAAHDRDRRRNSLRSAIAEAAGLTSFERNGDIVHFSSYAPLFGRRSHTQWHPDLIYFNGTDVFLTPNYYVQQLFGTNSGDTYLQTMIHPVANESMLAASTVRDSKTGDLIIKIVNGANESVSLNVEISGLEKKNWRATQTVLTGPSADAFNEDSKLPVIKPIISDVTIKPTFDYEAPGNSLTVYRILN
jgi:alpha-N-arabinofuranosidase